jgi:hypothetical protein
MTEKKIIVFSANPFRCKSEKTLSDRNRLQCQYETANELPAITIQRIRCSYWTTNTLRKNSKIKRFIYFQKIKFRTKKKSQKAIWLSDFLVEMMGVEPTTSRMRTERSPTELHPQMQRELLSHNSCALSRFFQDYFRFRTFTCKPSRTLSTSLFCAGSAQSVHFASTITCA